MKVTLNEHPLINDEIERASYRRRDFCNQLRNAVENDLATMSDFGYRFEEYVYSENMLNLLLPIKQRIAAAKCWQDHFDALQNCQERMTAYLVNRHSIRTTSPMNTLIDIFQSDAYSKILRDVINPAIELSLKDWEKLR